MKTEIILASASPRRLELFRQVGITPTVCASAVSEAVPAESAKEAAAERAALKARDVASRYAYQPVVVIGADTVVSVDEKILGKPRTKEEACRMIALIQGRAHEVYTGVCMIFAAAGEEESFVEKTEVRVEPMTPAEVRAYVDMGESMDKAGAYAIQGRFAAFISGITGDYNNVVGLPAAHICKILRKRQIDAR